jgi:hypothetical protein
LGVITRIHDEIYHLDLKDQDLNIIETGECPLPLTDMKWMIGMPREIGAKMIQGVVVVSHLQKIADTGKYILVTGQI